MTGPRARFAGRAALYVSAMSRLLRRGGGSVIGGRVALVLDPQVLASLARGRTVAIVSGTNGKTTTTRLLAAALGGPSRVATSRAGANLPSGMVAALAASAPGTPAVLEVDEGYVPKIAHDLHPDVVALLNLSRDQLDRVSEVRMVAARWRRALESLEGAVVVANADDPLVTWAAGAAPRVVWVAAGLLWHSDSAGCPSCEGTIELSTADANGDANGAASGHADGRASGWACACGFRRPAPDAWLEGEVLRTADGLSLELDLSVPGRFNRANASIALLAARALGVEPEEALARMKQVTDVEGRFSSVDYCGSRVRLLLAKNPAGWTELLEMIRSETRPVVIGINARVADGHDPSWLWDVPFERLAGRRAVATGERCMDLALRLSHAGVEHLVVRDQLEALRAARSDAVDYVGNYTAFQQLRRALADSARGVLDGGPLPHAPESVRVPTCGANEVGGGAGAADRSTSRAGRRAVDGVSALRVVVVHPDLLGTYGDGGNGVVLADRARWRGIDAELVLATTDMALPESADVYCLGGGEDGPQVKSAQLLASGGLGRAVDRGAAVLAVCAGFQVLGVSFPDAQGTIRSGVGLIDVRSVKGTSKRAVGELLVEAGDEGLDLLTGFENHAGITRLGSAVRPLGRVLRGIGNGTGDGKEGAVSGRVVCTYMHGPVLARNCALADFVLQMVIGERLTPLDDEEERALHAERLAAARPVGWRGLLSHERV